MRSMNISQQFCIVFKIDLTSQQWRPRVSILDLVLKAKKKNQPEKKVKKSCQAASALNKFKQYWGLGR